ncbi:Mor transcription activator family protein [Desulfobulbus sp.]|uniref:Mor transcription activator family protein n=1 Tax=Desulfobulbus sp. TaxID=895 RepID=UPI00286F170D|nr:Mor transcription activator family protein [Desulfobulbus sp.]
MLDNQLTGLPEQYRPPIDELPGHMQVIARAMEMDFPGLGVLITLALAQRVGGGPVYIHKMDKLMLSWRNDQIIAMYDRGGITIRELAWMWRLSQSSIEKILAQPSTGQKALEEKQLRLF